MKKRCDICNNLFAPNKFHPSQSVCLRKECQYLRQIRNQKDWRKKNPNYFCYKEKQTFADTRRAEYFRKWREAHLDYFKNYREKRKNNGENKS